MVSAVMLRHFFLEGKNLQILKTGTLPLVTLFSVIKVYKIVFKQWCKN